MAEQERLKSSINKMRKVMPDLIKVIGHEFNVYCKMEKELTEKVSFDFIRYANCWEDADILLAGLAPPSGAKILSIGSAGDNSFSLLCCRPSLVVAVDVNRTQLHLIELKKACIHLLAYEEILAFLGFHPSTQRKLIFTKIKKELSSSCAAYWEANLDQIESGIISQGKFEKYFQLFSKKILPWIHSPKTIQQLFAEKDAESQKLFYDKHWNTWRWKFLFKIFFSRFVMGKYGRDPEFLREVKVPVGTSIFNRAEKHLSSIAAQHNFMLRYNLKGDFENLLPHYLEPNNFQEVKKNLGQLEIFEGYAEDAIQKFGTFNSMNLSNIFEYMDQNLFRKTAAELLRATQPGGRIAYWNLMGPRLMSDYFKDELILKKELSAELSQRDKGFFYSNFIVEERR
jgi:S-adenosylmethionine-diacylglycerol 3-amino-3-carboxypropyl transferase